MTKSRGLSTRNLRNSMFDWKAVEEVIFQAFIL
jgi:hypothetical protein